MNKVVEQLEKIKDVEKRLRDLAQSRGTPNNVSADLLDKANGLKWACLELHRQFISDALLIIGTTDLLLEMTVLPSNEVFAVKDHPLLSYAVLLMPEKIIQEPLLDEFDRSQKGADIPFLPDWLTCRSYRGRITGSGRAVVFECGLLRQWLNDVGYKAAKVEVCNWLISIFPRMRWSNSGRISSPPPMG